MEVVLNFTDKQVDLFGDLLKYTETIVKSTEVEDEDGNVTIEEEIIPNPYTKEQFITGAIIAYVETYKRNSIREHISALSKTTTQRLEDPKSLEATVVAVEYYGLDALPTIIKGSL